MEMKKVIALMLVVGLCVHNVTPCMAMDKRITASYVKTEYKMISSKEANKYPCWTTGWYKTRAKGYVESPERHSCTVVLYGPTGEWTRSKQHWGKGRLNANTVYYKQACVRMMNAF